MHLFITVDVANKSLPTLGAVPGTERIFPPSEDITPSSFPFSFSLPPSLSSSPSLLSSYPRIFGALTWHVRNRFSDPEATTLDRPHREKVRWWRSPDDSRLVFPVPMPPAPASYPPPPHQEQRWLRRESACRARDPGSIPGWERSPGEENGNPLQYSCLENPMDGRAWRATVHGATESRTRLSDLTFLPCMPLPPRAVQRADSRADWMWPLPEATRSWEDLLHGHSDWDDRSCFVGLVQALSTAHSWLHHLEEGWEPGRRGRA